MKKLFLKNADATITIVLAIILINCFIFMFNTENISQ